MPATRRTCQYAGCNFGEDGSAYITMEGLQTHADVMKDLELHIAMTHGARGGDRGGAGPEVKPDKFPRPEINDPATDTDWEYFLSSWQSYKRATHLTGQPAADQLWHCPSSSLKKKVFDSGIRPTDTEEHILAGIKRLAVKAHNNMINIVQFQSIAQERDELVPQFGARIHGAAAICDFTVKCDCNKSVSYAEAMQSFQLVRGLYDTEIQEKILSEAANRDLKLSDIMKLAEAVESGKRSSGVLARSGGSLNRISTQNDRTPDNPRKCSYCAEKWHEGPNWKKFCKATGATCANCGRKGHLAPACRSKKPRAAKESNVVEVKDPDTPRPGVEGETSSMGFFCYMKAEINKLSHVGIDEFGKWARIKVDDHPEVVVDIEPDIEGYEELRLDKKPPPKHKITSTKALVDTGAQMVVMGLKTVYAMGLGKKNIMPVGMTIKAANTGGLRLLGGILVRITGQGLDGVERITRQLAYVAEEVDRVFLSKKACEELGIISRNFPIIGAYAIERDETLEADKTANDFITEIMNHETCAGLETGKCSCPTRELPPAAPTTCPFLLPLKI